MSTPCVHLERVLSPLSERVYGLKNERETRRIRTCNNKADDKDKNSGRRVVSDDESGRYIVVITVDTVLCCVSSVLEACGEKSS